MGRLLHGAAITNEEDANFPSFFGIADCEKLMEREKSGACTGGDPSAIAIADPAHSAPGDERFVNSGMSTKPSAVCGS